MQREDARRIIRGSWRQILPAITRPAPERVNGEISYICPICGHGTGANKGGLTFNPKSRDKNGLMCFGGSCTFRHGDIIDLYQQYRHIDFNTALDELADIIGITIDDPEPMSNDEFSQAIGYTGSEPSKRPDKDEKEAEGTNMPEAPKPAQNGPEMPLNEEKDFTGYYKACKEWLSEAKAAAYLKSRGISVQTAAACWIGYDPEADPAGAPGAMGREYKAHPVPRLIIPTSKSHYVGRRIDGVQSYEKMNPKGGSPGIFNGAALYAPDVREVFVTEGAFDALSVVEGGFPAIALNSANNATKLLQKLKEKPTKATLILCLDNDEAGAKAAQELHTGLKRLNIPHIKADICGSCKDPNEALVRNRAAFIRALEEAKRHTEARPDNTSYYIDNLMGTEIEQFQQEIKTGFERLDKSIGGLYSGLYVIAAISSLGKTTFTLQMADQIAEGGTDVIIFSLEQSRLELVSKSIARRTVKWTDGRDPVFSDAVTSLQIRRGRVRDTDLILKTAAAYKEAVGERVNIIEGNFDCDVSFIGDYVEDYIRRTEARPVVIIDYLQILQPSKDMQWKSTKEAVDHTISELKRLSRDLEITVIVISSVNRANYMTPISFESLKESGAIEFGADVVWGLQLEILNTDEFSKLKDIKDKREEVMRAKAATPREVELVCLKNRYGTVDHHYSFRYYPANDLFVEEEGLPFTGGYEGIKWVNL